MTPLNESHQMHCFVAKNHQESYNVIKLFIILYFIILYDMILFYMILN